MGVPPVRFSSWHSGVMCPCRPGTVRRQEPQAKCFAACDSPRPPIGGLGTWAKRARVRRTWRESVLLRETPIACVVRLRAQGERAEHPQRARCVRSAAQRCPAHDRLFLRSRASQGASVSRRVGIPRKDEGSIVGHRAGSPHSCSLRVFIFHLCGSDTHICFGATEPICAASWRSYPPMRREGECIPNALQPGATARR